jgi:aldose sugar dehydrogenase
LIGFFIYSIFRLLRLVSTYAVLSNFAFILLSIPALDQVGAGRNAADDLDISRDADSQPLISDADLKVEEVVGGLELPTSMAFLGPNDFLVLEKQTGIVKRVLDGTILEQPVLDVSVANENERGMLGLAVENDTDDKIERDSNRYAFAMFTESDEDGSDGCNSGTECGEDGSLLGNRLYRYKLVNNKLTDRVLLLDLPATPGPAHNGGALIIGPDNNIYLTIGDVRCGCTQAENVQGGNRPDGRAGILRTTLDGKPVTDDAIIGKGDPINFYYAYGIRNSFGIAFDPITGNLWDTENGPGENDEINLVEPGFNSGYKWIQGVMKNEDDISSLENFSGQGRYSNPEFVWTDVVGPTAVTFLDNNRLGQQYANDMFVGDVHRGNLYHFDLNKERTDLMLDGPLKDKVADDDEELDDVIFGRNFAGISDIEVGPDGYLYIVSIGLGKIFRIVPVGR